MRKGEKQLESYSSSGVKNVVLPQDAEVWPMGWIAKGGKEAQTTWRNTGNGGKIRSNPRSISRCLVSLFSSIFRLWAMYSHDHRRQAVVHSHQTRIRSRNLPRGASTCTTHDLTRKGFFPVQVMWWFQHFEVRVQHGLYTIIHDRLPPSKHSRPRLLSANLLLLSMLSNGFMGRFFERPKCGELLWRERSVKKMLRRASAEAYRNSFRFYRISCGFDFSRLLHCSSPTTTQCPQHTSESGSFTSEKVVMSRLGERFLFFFRNRQEIGNFFVSIRFSNSLIWEI